MDIHWIDIVILGTLFIMFAFSCWKGLIKEAFSLGSLFISILAANQFYQLLAPQLLSFFSTKIVSEIASFIIIFVVLVILLRIIGNLIQAKLVDGSSTMTFINRTGGGLLGLAKGMLILIVLLIPIMNIPPAKEFVYDNSKFVGYIENAAVILTSVSTNESLYKKVRDKDGMMGDLRDKTMEVYKKAQETVTEATKAVIESKAVEAIKEKGQELMDSATETATEHKDVITEKDKNELDNMIDKIVK